MFKTNQIYPQTHHGYYDGNFSFAICSESQGHNNTVACLEKPQVKLPFLDTAGSAATIAHSCGGLQGSWEKLQIKGITNTAIPLVLTYIKISKNMYMWDTDVAV